jgi:hypothetical protein
MSIGTRPALALTTAVALLFATAHCNAAVANDPGERPPRGSEICTIVFVDGPTLHVPRALLQVASCDGTRPVAKWLTMALEYPSMTASRAFGEIEIGNDKLRGVWVPHRDRFTVDILTLFYSRPIPNAGPYDWVGPEPPPWRIIENRTNMPGGGGYPSPQISPSTFPGLRELHFGPPASAAQVASAVRRFGMNPYGREHAYIETPNAEYALLMDCGPDVCTGHLHLKDSHLQYRFMIPAEAIEHSADFVAEMNAMLRRWMSK